MTVKSSVLGDLEQSREIFEACVRDIDRWMLHNNLKMNSDKTELLILHSKHRRQPPLDSTGVIDTLIFPTQSARSIGVVFDSTVNFDKHVNEICKSAFYHIINISQVRRYLDIESTKTLVHVRFCHVSNRWL